MKKFKIIHKEWVTYVEAPSKKYAVDNGIRTLFANFSMEYATPNWYMHTFKTSLITQ
jgi:hypothetical protein